jgi:hypothetical protein
MTDDDVEKIIKRNINFQMNLAGIRADFEEAQQRTWVGLTDDEMQDCLNGLPTQTIDVYARRIEAKLKEKNCI